MYKDKILKEEITYLIPATALISFLCFFVYLILLKVRTKIDNKIRQKS